MNARRVALLTLMLVVAGGVVSFGFAGAASAAVTPSISTSDQPATATIGSAVADKATLTVPGTATCPPQDQLGFALGPGSNTSTNPIFCSYPAVPGENPNDFFCTYDQNTGVLVTDNDAGLCPTNAIGGGGPPPTGTVTFNLYNNPNGTGPALFTDTESVSGGSATSASFAPGATGTDYWVATYNGDSNYNAVTSGTSDEPVVINQAVPSINTTQLPASAPVGTPIADQATVSGGDNPTGTVTFSLYNNPSGTGPALFTDTEPLSGGTATSVFYTATATGTDYWVATYNGDSNNSSVASGTADEPVTVTPVTPSINTSQQPASATVGSLIADQATVSGGFNPTGTVTFSLYDNPNGTGTPLFTDTETLSGGTATTGSYTTTATGTDYWVATYNGDSNNNSVTSGVADEPVTVNQATPSIATSQQPGSVTVGGSIADKATVSGGDSPTGTVTFSLYDNPNGTGPALFTDTEPLSGGSATSAGYTTAATGTDYWVATYNGDSNNNSVSSGVADEPVTINPKTTPSIATSQQPSSATVGSSIADQATVSVPGGISCPPQDEAGFPLGQSDLTTDPIFCSYPAVPGENPNDFFCTYSKSTGALVQDSDAGLCPPNAVGTSAPSPTGTVTFTLYDNPNGTGTPLFTDTESLVNGVATSLGYTATATGTDYWVATYNGDSNNNSVSSGNSDEPVAINAATPSINTTQQPASATVGTSIADQATVSGGFNPTGTVTFNLYSSPTTQNATTLLFSDTESLSSGTATSAGYMPTATGTDYWVATYNGDSNNNSNSTGGTDEPVSVNQATPSIGTTQQPSSATVNNPIADKATVSGGDNPTGMVTFNLYASGVDPAIGPPLFTDTESLSAGTATSASYTPTAPGTYHWVATYNGDSNNSSVASGLLDEPVTINKATPSIATSQQPATVTVGGSIADQATVSGGDSPTGTVTFNLYNNLHGTGPALFTDTEPLSNGSATSASFTTTATGTDYWVATYNGDSNNNSVSSGLAAESVSIHPASPSLGPVSAPSSVTVGTKIAPSSISALLSGGSSASGTVTFKVFGPQSSPPSSCSTGGTTVGSATVSGDGTYNPSAGVTAAHAGDYWWYARYGGDSNNHGANSGCGAGMAETVVSAPSVYAGYADYSPNGTVSAPSPWQGSAGVIFEGCNYFTPDRCPKTKSGADRYDAGAIRINNTTGATLTITNASVVVGYCTFHPWPGLNVTLPAGKQLILTQTGGAGPCPNTDGGANFDTSDTPHSYKSCTRDHVIGVLHVSINGAAVSFRDTSQILNTGGVDLGAKACGSHNEFHPWGQISPP
jgi:hypothetical protein